MKAAIYGFRKIGIFIISVSAIVYLAHVSLDALREISDAKATQAAIIVGTAFGALGTVFTALMSAFKSGYERDAEIAKVTPPVPPASSPPV